MSAAAAHLSPSILFGVVTMGFSEALRRQFALAYGTETHASMLYSCL